MAKHVHGAYQFVNEIPHGGESGVRDTLEKVHQQQQPRRKGQHGLGLWGVRLFWLAVIALGLLVAAIGMRYVLAAS